MTEASASEPTTSYQFDYTNQAWLKDGVYVRCRHSSCMKYHLATGLGKVCALCCFGTRHAGERPNLTLMPYGEVH